MQTVFVAELVLVMVIVCFKNGESLKCYQCRTDVHKGCNSANLDPRYLKSCPIQANATSVFCRKIYQKLIFREESDYTSIRECASSKDSRACYKFELYTIAAQETCECDTDSCNEASTSLLANNVKFILAYFVWILFNFVQR